MKKLIPPPDVLEAELSKSIEEKIRSAFTERILREARFEDQIAEAIAAIEKPDAAALEDGIEELFEEQPDAQWRDHITAVAEELSDKAE
jgi:hypothetical protein